MTSLFQSSQLQHVR